KSLKGEEINYNAIITLATNHAYYLGQKTKETAEILNKNLSFVLLLEIDFVELEEYQKEILVNSKLTNDQTLYIQKGLHLLRNLYFSEMFIKYRKEDEETKIYFKDIYRKILEEMENDFQNKSR
ncbi:MAG TPA: hypothetical protein PLE98_00385, partial [Candidatus Dojkabacteria bacterium]|nr:hypothetical protein [Candidatus Dojkabacteria bacterium]